MPSDLEKAYPEYSETARLEKPLSDLEKAYSGMVVKGKKAAGAALSKGADVVGGAADFLGSVMETPKAALIHAVAGTKTPVSFSPTADVDQIREYIDRMKAEGFDPKISPELVSFLTDFPVAGAMNKIGRYGVLPIARAIGEPLRKLPIARDIAEFVKTGSSLPAKYRQPAQDIMRTAEGQASLSAAKRQASLGPYLKLSQAEQDAVQAAIERRGIQDLPDGLKPAARALEAEYGQRVAARSAVGGKPHELGSHLTPEQQANLPAFTDRPMTSQMRQEAGIKGYGEARALGTGGLKYRTEAGRAMTTDEINKMLEAQGKQRLDPVVKAAMDMGSANDSRVMKLRIVNDLTKRFGVPTTKPGEAVLRHEGIGAGVTKGQRQFLGNRKLPPELDALVARLNRRLEPEQYGDFLNVSKKINDNFKKWAVFSPGFTSRNWQNNVFQLAMFEDIGPKELGLIKQVAKPSPQLVSEAISMGVLGGGQTAQEVTGKMGPVFRFARGANQFGEDKARLWLYLIRKAKGDSPLKAASRVDDILFNYSSRLASPTRKKIGRHFVPFVNWSTFIPGLTARAVMERPGSVALAGNMRARQNRKMGYDDERLASEFGPWNLPQGVVANKESQGLIPQFVGQYSVNELVPSGIEDATNKLAEKLYPQYGTLIGLGAGRNTFKGQSFWYDPESKQHERFATAPSALRVIFNVPGGPEFAKAHGISIDPVTKKVIAPARLAYVLGKFPQARLANIAADWIAGVKGKEATAQSFGLGVRTVDKYEPRRSPGGSHR